MAGSAGAIQGPLNHAGKTHASLARKMRMEKRWVRELGHLPTRLQGWRSLCSAPAPTRWHLAGWGASGSWSGTAAQPACQEQLNKGAGPWSLNPGYRGDMGQMKGCPSTNTRGQCLRQAQWKIQRQKSQ